MPGQNSSPTCDSGQFRAARQGVGWVLGWAFSLAVFAVAAVLIVRLAYMISAEQALVVAAEAAVREAALPRATLASVEAAADRRLAQVGLATAHRQVVLRQNGASAARLIRSRPGDRLSVAIAAPARDALPTWLRQLSRFGQQSQLNVHVEHVVKNGY